VLCDVYSERDRGRSAPKRGRRRIRSEVPRASLFHPTPEGGGARRLLRVSFRETKDGSENNNLEKYATKSHVFHDRFSGGEVSLWRHAGGAPEPRAVMGGGVNAGGSPKPPIKAPTSTLLFRVFNPELYVGYNKWVALGGSLICGMAILNVGLMKYEREMELKREREENKRIP